MHTEVSAGYIDVVYTGFAVVAETLVAFAYEVCNYYCGTVCKFAVVETRVAFAF